MLNYQRVMITHWIWGYLIFNNLSGYDKITIEHGHERFVDLDIKC